MDHTQVITKPIFVGTVNGRPIRFFKSPRPEIGHQFPWHAHADLADCLELPVPQREFFRQKTAALGPDMVRSVATEAGILLIASHGIAQGLIGAALEFNPPTPRDIEARYAEAGVGAVDVLGLTLEQLGEAFRNG